MTQATKVLSKAAKNTGESLEKALNVKDPVQKATNDLGTLNSQMSSAKDAGEKLSDKLSTLFRTGGVALTANTFGSLAGAYLGSRSGDTAGSIASSTVSNTITGAAIGGTLFPTPLGFAAGAAIDGLLGAVSGIIQTYEKRDDAYKDWYRGLYENTGSETERMLTAGRSAAQETLGQPEAELKAVQGKLDAAGGEGYYAERNQGIAEQITAYGGELGEALAEANRAIGAGRAAMENLADSYTQEALSAVLTGSETSLQWSDDNAQRLQEMGALYQEAMADYEAGNTEAGALVETYIEEARALAEAQYDSSEAALGVAEAEKDLITSINENTAALRGWRGDYDVSQALTKGRAPPFCRRTTTPTIRAASTTMPTRTPLSRSGPWASTMCPMTTFPLCCIRASGCRRRWRLEASGVARRSPLPETPSASGRTRIWTGWPARCCKKSNWRKGGPQSGTR